MERLLTKLYNSRRITTLYEYKLENFLGFEGLMVSGFLTIGIYEMTSRK